MDTVFVPNVEEFELEVEDFRQDETTKEWINVTFLVRWDETNEEFYPIRAYYNEHMFDLERDSLVTKYFLVAWKGLNLSEYAWNEYQKRYV